MKPLMMPAMTDTIEAKRVQSVALEDEEKRLTTRINELTTRVLALQDEAEARRKEMSAAYRDRYAKRFPSLDCAKALAGYATSHDAKVFGAVYRLRPPKQSEMLDVDRFAAKPDPATLGPVSAAERLLLAWLTGVGAGTDVRDVTGATLGDRLVMIRKLPEALLTKLADECGSIDSYLGVVLEIELGGS